MPGWQCQWPASLASEPGRCITYRATYIMFTVTREALQPDMHQAACLQLLLCCPCKETQPDMHRANHLTVWAQLHRDVWLLLLVHSEDSSLCAAYHCHAYTDITHKQNGDIKQQSHPHNQAYTQPQPVCHSQPTLPGHSRTEQSSSATVCRATTSLASLSCHAECPMQSNELPHCTSLQPLKGVKHALSIALGAAHMMLWQSLSSQII